jgi:hypothetical protein
MALLERLEQMSTLRLMLIIAAALSLSGAASSIRAKTRRLKMRILRKLLTVAGAIALALAGYHFFGLTGAIIGGVIGGVVVLSTK